MNFKLERELVYDFIKTMQEFRLDNIMSTLIVMYVHYETIFEILMEDGDIFDRKTMFEYFERRILEIREEI